MIWYPSRYECPWAQPRTCLARLIGEGIPSRRNSEARAVTCYVAMTLRDSAFVECGRWHLLDPSSLSRHTKLTLSFTFCVSLQHPHQHLILQSHLTFPFNSHHNQRHRGSRRLHPRDRHFVPFIHPIISPTLFEPPWPWPTTTGIT